MTDTTTAEHTTTVLDPTAAGGELAVVDAEDLAIQPGQSVWTPKQLAILRQIGLEEAQQADIDLFFHVCQMSGLDPFRREIYMIGRKTKVNVREVNPETGNERTVEQYVMKFTIQTGINGFRKRAREIAEKKGIRIGFAGPLWCAEDGQWRDVWPEGKPPVAAKFTVFRDGEAISFVAHYAEYVQTSGVGQAAGPNSMWKKMPANQTGKCAEAGAIQRAFPDELGGLLLEDAVRGDVIDSDGRTVSRREPTKARGVAALSARVVPAEGRDVPAENIPPDVTPPAGMTPTSRKKWLNRMFALLAEADCPDRDDQLIVIAGLAGRTPDEKPEHRDALSDDELRTVVNALNAAGKEQRLGAVVTDLLNSAALREVGQESADE
jgi:phage recombination protein Bet